LTILLKNKLEWRDYEMITGYVFINTEKGRTLDVVPKVGNIKGVKTACVITGTFDIVATYEVEDVKDVGEMVARGIDGIDGVALTQTAICVKCC
jgi:DNA-binding Lrp family transcriptional regulator